MPTVSIDTPTSFAASLAFPVSFNFSEVVSGFAMADITVTNGSASAPTQDASDMTLYTVEVTPSSGLDADDQISITIAANVVRTWLVMAILLLC